MKVWIGARSSITKKAQVYVELTMVNHLVSRSEKTKKVLNFCSLESLANTLKYSIIVCNLAKSKIDQS